MGPRDARVSAASPCCGAQVLSPYFVTGVCSRCGLAVMLNKLADPRLCAAVALADRDDA
jgi:hypothetical protein